MIKFYNEKAAREEEIKKLYENNMKVKILIFDSIRCYKIVARFYNLTSEKLLGRMRGKN